LDTGSSTSALLVTKPGSFGVPIYPATVTTTAAKGTAAKGTPMTSTKAGAGFTTIGTPRGNAQYFTTVNPKMVTKQPVPMQFAANLNATLAGSGLSPTRQLNVRLDDAQTIVLQGIVESEEDKRLAEGVLRLEPGANRYFVRNEITVVPGKDKN
jgi:hypothetical protein